MNTTQEGWVISPRAGRVAFTLKYGKHTTFSAACHVNKATVDGYPHSADTPWRDTSASVGDYGLGSLPDRGDSTRIRNR